MKGPDTPVTFVVFPTQSKAHDWPAPQTRPSWHVAGVMFPPPAPPLGPSWPASTWDSAATGRAADPAGAARGSDAGARRGTAGARRGTAGTGASPRNSPSATGAGASPVTGGARRGTAGAGASPPQCPQRRRCRHCPRDRRRPTSHRRSRGFPHLASRLFLHDTRTQ